jgi:hypothetical protein
MGIALLLSKAFEAMEIMEVKEYFVKYQTKWLMCAVRMFNFVQ